MTSKASLEARWRVASRFEAGTQPSGRWGAGIVLDPSDNLYIIGGSSFDRATRQFSVLSDIHIFQARCVCAFTSQPTQPHPPTPPPPTPPPPHTKGKRGGGERGFIGGC